MSSSEDIFKEGDSVQSTILNKSGKVIKVHDNLNHGLNPDISVMGYTVEVEETGLWEVWRHGYDGVFKK